MKYASGAAGALKSCRMNCRVPENECQGNCIALQCKGCQVEKMRQPCIKNSYIEDNMANVDLFMKQSMQILPSLSAMMNAYIITNGIA